LSIEKPAGLAERLRAAASAQPPDIGTSAGRGIVICAGGTRLFTCAWLLVAMLRRTFHCRLPIEVWHIGPAEMGPPMRALLEAFEVNVIDALKVALRHPVETLGGWQLKTYALMHSDFREILLLDADNMPAKDPTFLFDGREFADTGAVFWPDIVRLRASNPIWAISGLPVDSGATFETGQLLIDKVRHWRVLNLAHWINQNHRAFDDLLFGDKDACYIAWRMLGEPYYLIEHAPKLLEHTFMQRSPDGGLLFQHRNGAKWLLNGPNPRIEGFRYEAECFALLAELRKRWDGTVFNPPARSVEARAIERDLVSAASFRMVWVGSHEYPLTLRSQHLMEGGDAATENCWFVADGADGPELRLAARGVLGCALRREADAVWRGRAGEFAVELHPVLSGHAACPNPATSGLSTALLAIADSLLEGADNLSGGAAAEDLVTTLATLARLDAELPDYLEDRAQGRRQGSALALAALEKFRATPQTAAPDLAGTGWRMRPANLEEQSEAMPKR
jgi:Mannosyltransferase putative